MHLISCLSYNSNIVWLMINITLVVFKHFSNNELVFTPDFWHSCNTPTYHPFHMHALMRSVFSLISSHLIIAGASIGLSVFINIFLINSIALYKDIIICIRTPLQAHCISEWSHNFRPAYMHLHHVLTDILHITCILALTATATVPTQVSCTSVYCFVNVIQCFV